MAQISSAWVVVIISMDRWIRTRFPFQSKILCTPRKALIPVTILVFVDISHMLTPLFGQLLSGVALVACGPNLQNIYYLDFYYFTWTIMQINFYVHCLTSKLFRKEFLGLIKCRPKRNQSIVVPIITHTIAVHFTTKSS